jgi:hypothetical protein
MGSMLLCKADEERIFALAVVVSVVVDITGVWPAWASLFVVAS